MRSINKSDKPSLTLILLFLSGPANIMAILYARMKIERNVRQFDRIISAQV
jgi:hypothetical protein